MPSSRKKFNLKRRFAANLPEKDELEKLAAMVRYGGNPEHKRNPGDFGLTPPSQPRADKSLCDGIQVFRREEALRLLRLGVKAGMVSPWDGTAFPKNIWSMTKDGIPLEAQLENPGNGTYHGYPLETNDVFRQSVIDKWNRHHG